MKVNIFKKIDLSEIDKAVDIYEAEHTIDFSNSRRYLIMSYKTFSTIAAETGFNVKSIYNGINEYHGYRIAIDNGIEFGEVEIR